MKCWAPLLISGLNIQEILVFYRKIMNASKLRGKSRGDSRDDEFYGPIFKNIPSIMTKAAEAKIDAHIILGLMTNILLKFRYNSGHIFENLPLIIERSKVAGFAPSDILIMLNSILKYDNYVCIGAFRSMHLLIDKAHEANISPSDINRIIIKLIDKCESIKNNDSLHTEFSAMKSFEHAAEFICQAKTIDCTPEEIMTVFTNILDNCDKNIMEILSSLCFIDNAHSLGCTKKSILDFINNSIITYKDDACKVFTALPSIFKSGEKAKLTGKQCMDIMNKIIERSSPGYDSLNFDFFDELVSKAISAGFNNDQITALVIGIADKCEKKELRRTLDELPKSIAKLKSFGKNADTISILLLKFAQKLKKIGPEYVPSFIALYSPLSFSDDSARSFAFKKYLAAIDSLTDYNGERILELISNNRKLFQDIANNAPGAFTPHFNLYLNVITHRKRLSLTILEGILEATKKKVVPWELSEDEIRKINNFIDRTNGFSPFLYSLYKEHGASFLDDFAPFLENIRRDQVGGDEIKKLASKYRSNDAMEVLFSAIQMVIPMSGASMVKRDEAIRLLKYFIDSGDRRNDVPQALRGVIKECVLGVEKYTVKDGETIDPAGEVRKIIGSLRLKDNKGLPELISALEDYLKSGRDEKQKENVRQVLYSYVSRRDILGEKVDRLSDTDYYTLRLLEELFRDKECLASILADVMEKVDQTLFQKGKQTLNDPDSVIKALVNTWKSEMPKDLKLNVLAKMIAKYQPNDVLGKVVPVLRDMDLELAHIVEEISGNDNIAFASRQSIAEDLLKVPLAIIQKEKAKYISVNSEEGVRLSLQVVKGIPYSLWGLNAGVCIASDIALWKNPDFKLVAMIDSGTGTAVGFIHIFEVVIGGKKVWTIPGIEPSTEFIGTVDPKELYDKTMEQLMEFARASGAKAVYIPTNSTIHSNRSDIQKCIASNNYRKKNIPQVQWSNRPAYPFEEVYVAWED